MHFGTKQLFNVKANPLTRHSYDKKLNAGISRDYKKMYDKEKSREY